MSSALERILSNVGEILAQYCQSQLELDAHATMSAASMASKAMRGIFLEHATKTAYIQQPKARKLGGPAAFKSYVNSARVRKVVMSSMRLDKEWLMVLGEMSQLQELYLLEVQLLDIAPHRFANLAVWLLSVGDWILLSTSGWYELYRETCQVNSETCQLKSEIHQLRGETVQ
ncbi:hypothetical protein C8J56DRAFT_894386 [Mycena floridula]|nr:hypothetical protein C8J56DRAFT_894386 [Mycena floridula]